MYAVPADRPAPAAWGPALLRAVRAWPVRWRTLASALAGVVFVVGSGLLLTSGEASATVSGAVRALGGVHWAVVPALAGLMVAHFWCSAVALRGAAGRRLPLLHATMAQFTAATANRVTGGGLGTVAVNARYLSSRGTPAAPAAAAAGVLQIGGAVADLLLFVVIIPVALATGGGVLLSQLGTYFSGLAGPLTIVAAAAAVVAGAAVWLLRDRLRDPIAACAQIMRRPGDLLLMMAASAATTLIMGIAFAVSMLAIPAAATPGQIGTLIAVYMIAAAAGGVVPGPGGLGSTEAALVALLSVTGIETASALSGVLIFRAVTHWAPVPIGLLSAGTLRTGASAAGRPGGPRRQRAAGTTLTIDGGISSGAL
ncbi:lysylphosphatidylglycerol synthase transmembrane domain-containing protein [Actinomadura scrupuli]|uniref:lysylphosphatidylglycerol synthase transmembrane domain-containing protein n=1 Tax=Actinomadura scrupuli TaxID=559629 RepID=UPI003D95B934